MNADRLLGHYERIADEPDAIARLRRFILDLAVRGKLVEQDPEDESAAELVKRIAAEKARLVKTGEIKKQSALPPVAPSEEPFSVPNVWGWTRIGSAAYVEMGQSPPSEHYNRAGHGVPFFQGKADFGKRYPTARYWCTQPKKHAAQGDILISVRAPVGPTNVASEPCCIGRGLAALRSHNGIDRYFLLRCLEAFEHELAALGFGTTFVAINKNQLTGFVVPLPPLAEQHRIVAKVDELVALCDRLEKARADREATRDRMAAASLIRLNDPDPDPAVFQNHAAFALEKLTPLTTRCDQIKALRQTILNLAVRGRLVEQDPNDEPASELLKRIAVEKIRLVQEGKFKTLGGDLPKDEASSHFPVPSNWVWCYLNDLAAIARGCSPRPIKSYLTDDPNGIPWIKIGDSVRGNIYIDGTKERIRPEGLAKSRLVVPGDLLLSNSMSFGFPYITNLEGCIHDGWLVIRTPDALIDKLYIHTLFLSDHAKAAFFEAASGAVVQNLNAAKARRLLIPLPPLAEQHRIVAKVDELMALCDRLETSLTTGDDTRRRLLDALLHEVLVMGADRKSVA